MKKSRLIVLTLVLALLASLFCACGGSSGTDADAAKAYKQGVLTYLNISEDEYQEFLKVRTEIIDILKESGYVTDSISDAPRAGAAQSVSVKYYDSLDAMLMALKAGEIDYLEVFQSTAEYLCAQDSELVSFLKYDLSKERVRFAKAAMGSLTTGFSFMMLEEKAELRDAFNTVIAEMKADGTLDSLAETYIKGVGSGSELTAVQPENVDGRDTLRVAVTGALPPFDDVAADGTPAGYNTAVLAEIGKRLDKNIELVQVDSIGRAAALSGGTADIVFWTRSAEDGDMFHVMSGDQFKEFSTEKKAKFAENEIALLEKLDGVMSREKAYDMDMPTGTVITDPYYIDVAVPVALSSTVDGLTAK